MMAIQIYNTMKKQKEPFVPLQEGAVGMYACGVTVYDLSHIGHARALIVFDVIYRYLKYRGYKVTFVRNYTDVDDKIIKRAQEEGVTYKDISERYIKEFDRDMDLLGLERPTVCPRATDHIPEMIAMVQALIEKGFAYEVDGDVYFDVGSFSAYGKLSGKNIEDLNSGARVEVDERKKSPLDFALWKKSKEGEPFWECPWGKGRPGWHIECSAMSQKYLGTTFDIHGGGMDLIFPHHENEIAQAECATGAPFARYWIHNGFVNINQQKMSKSLKNFFSIREILETYHPEVLRLFLLSNHYRSPVDYSEQNLTEAKVGLDRFYALLRDLDEITSLDKGSAAQSLGEKRLAAELQEFPEKFTAAMDDDFNTAAALGHLYTLTRSLNALVDQKKKFPTFQIAEETFARAREQFQMVGNIFGLFRESPQAYFAKKKEKGIESAGISPDEIASLIKERELARRGKDFKKADEIRKQLEEKGILLKDTPQGTEWTTKQ
jgi:cysteinyl-tRNA synthetase